MRTSAADGVLQPTEFKCPQPPEVTGSSFVSAFGADAAVWLAIRGHAIWPFPALPFPDPEGMNSSPMIPADTTCRGSRSGARMSSTMLPIPAQMLQVSLIPCRRDVGGGRRSRGSSDTDEVGAGRALRGVRCRSERSGDRTSVERVCPEGVGVRFVSGPGAHRRE